MRRAGSLVSVAFALLTFSAGTLGGCGKDDVEFPPDTTGGGGNTLVNSITPAPGGARRLLARQYVNSVGVLFGDAAAAAAVPPPDSALHGFATIGNANVALDAASVEQYETSALAVADAFIQDQASYDAALPCMPSGPTDQACFSQFVTKLGRLAWRRDLTSDEVTALTNIAVAAGGEYTAFEMGVRYAIVGLLTSPDFLYLVEVGEADPDAPTRFWLTQPELVTRIAFFLTDTTPTEAMLDAALAGELATEDDIRAMATELLQRPEAKQVTRAFFDELYGLSGLETLSKDAASFPEWTDDAALAMRESTHLMLEDIIWARDTDFRELMTADYAFVNEDLAPIYDMNVAGKGMVKLPLPASQNRVGLLGQASYLSIQAKTTRESPTKRGLFIRRTLLCDDIPPPPPNVNPNLPDPDPNNPQTMKERLEEHKKDPSCATCHAMTDPPGYPLQFFDGSGKWRPDENGLPIDTSGDSPGIGTFADIHELAQLIRDNASFGTCVVRNFYRHSIGRLEEQGEEPAIEAIDLAFEENGFGVQTLLVELVASPAFAMVGEPK